ncbi:lytic transglycosylase [Oleiphilus messinensis]|uniref:Lytic transglycosylase n=1 Tax=Oleiphilus messinensis TaxID=141451 RepID=A0A1Y0I7Q3_9GAMM|nr:lytic transglycosylase F [Oleiphilus messinensis]ARU55474.1 lytic transglycosylase [Oleiphilus messinensis]
MQLFQKQKSMTVILFSMWFVLINLLSGCQPDSDDHGIRSVSPEQKQQEKERDRIEAELLSKLDVEKYQGDLPVLLDKKVIRALVTYSPTDFFLHDGHILGLQADALREFEKQLNQGVRKAKDKVRIKFVPVPFNRLIPALNEGVGDIAAGMLTVTTERQALADFVAGHLDSVDEVVVRFKNAPAISSLSDLQGKEVHLMRGSSYVEHLKQYNQKQADLGHTVITGIETDSRLLSEDILELVNAGIFQYTIVDGYKARLWSTYLDQIVIEQNVVLATGNQIGWAIRKNSPELHKALQHFFETKAKKGTLFGNMLNKRYLEPNRWLKNPLQSNDRDKLNKILPLFQKYGDQYNIMPLALAAQAYQESKFNQALRSHRGALGIMQLLPSTAKDKNIGIKKIDTLEPNIHAGAKYLAFLRDRYFSDPAISEQDRLFFSWAAYNAGPAKVSKMRNLAEEMGLDRNRWFGNVEHAAARLIGNETVDYVSHIFKYYTAYTLANYLVSDKNDVLKTIPSDTNNTLSVCETAFCDTLQPKDNGATTTPN